LQQGLAVILAFVGVKMIIAEWYHIPTAASLGFIGLVLAVSIGLSMARGGRDGEPPGDEIPEGLEALESSPPSRER
jgi:tellurite resistance protein TerC